MIGFKTAIILHVGHICADECRVVCRVGGTELGTSGEFTPQPLLSSLC